MLIEIAHMEECLIQCLVHYKNLKNICHLSSPPLPVTVKKSIP